ncbi:VOC family protein [bacterium]|nr:VOC family protein [bacterium]
MEYYDVPSEKVRVAMLKGNTTIELLEPTDGDSAVAKFLQGKGPGLHHCCFAVPPPLAAKIDELKAAGFRVLDDAPRPGAVGKVCFVHPKSAGGILMEFIEKE